MLALSRLSAQVRTVAILATTMEAPIMAPLTRLLTREPRLEDTELAGVPTTVIFPAGSGPWPTFVFVNGATPQGRQEPNVRRASLGLARAGYLVVLPEPPGLAAGEVTARTIEGTIGVTRAAAGLADVADLGLIGISAGTTLALIAAAEPDVAGQVRLVAGIAPLGDLANVVCLATTAHYRDEGRFVPYEARAWLTLVVARSLTASLAESGVLVRALRAVEDTDPDPLAGLRATPPAGLTPDEESVLELLLNRDTGRFDELYDALPAEVRSLVETLSPLRVAHRVRAAIELATAPDDPYFPLSECRALSRVAPAVRITVTPMLAHATPKLSLQTVRSLGQLNAFAVRALRLAAG